MNRRRFIQMLAGLAVAPALPTVGASSETIVGFNGPWGGWLNPVTGEYESEKIRQRWAEDEEHYRGMDDANRVQICSRSQNVY